MQMFVYNELLGAPRSLLLYPDTQTGGAVHGSYADRAHGCGQCFLGLADGQRWSTRRMKEQVGALLAEHAGA
jgi:hypothetical protein